MRSYHLLWWGWLLLLLGACDTAVPDLRPSTVTPIPTLTPIPTETPMPDRYTPTGFRQFITTAEDALRGDRQGLVIDYMADLGRGPLTGEGEATFVWRGPARAVSLRGDMNGWENAPDQPMTNLDGTDLWYTTLELSSAARLDYLFVIDGRTVLDVMNDRTQISGVGLRSKLVMPGYTPPPELAADRDAGTQTGTVASHTLESEALGQTRTVFVYTPAVPPLEDAYPAVYLQDGTDYLNLIDTPRILDWLIEKRHIPPLVAVFVPPIDRVREYDYNEAYTRFLADEVVPFVRRTYNTTAEPAQTAVGGVSRGGTAAAYAALSRPEVFGRALVHSGAVSLQDDGAARFLERIDPVDVRFHLVVGTYETAVLPDPAVGDFLAANRHLSQRLQQHGYEHAYEEFPEGHSWGLWQAQLGNGLRYLFTD